MASYKYLIVGGGMTANAAAQGIRETDKTVTIGMFSAESHPPYNRPPLSKALWKGDSTDSIWLPIDKVQVDLHLGRQVHALNPSARTATDDKGTVHHYEKLLLATGGTPRRLPSGDDAVIYYRTFDDYQRLRNLVKEGRRFVVIGGGFIGSEIGAALTMNGAKVSMVIPEAAIGGRIYPADLAQFVNSYYRDKGIELHTRESVSDVHRKGERAVVKTQNGLELAADAVVAGLGIQPNIDLAKAAGLKIEDGVVVDESLRTSDPNIYAAGDVAAFFNPALGKPLRVEHEDNANTMGRIAGQSMAGAGVKYDHLPFFYSDLFELGYEAIGETDSRLTTYSDWKEQFREGVTYYLKDGRVRGVLLWNVWGQIDAARELITEPGPFNQANLKGRLPAA